MTKFRFRIWPQSGPSFEVLIESANAHTAQAQANAQFGGSGAKVTYFGEA